MKYNIIGTGSTGNAVIINDEIMIDCGVPYRKIEPYVKGLKLTLLTHIHSDHFNKATIKKLHFIRPTLRFVCCEWLVRPLIDCGVDSRVIDVCKFDVPGMSTRALLYNNLAIIKPVPLTHDVQNCGYKICTHTEWLFYATDTSTLDGIEARNCDLYMIEANHGEEEIGERIKTKIDSGEFAYELRAKRTHLSEEQATKWLLENIGPNSEYIFLHKSKNYKKENK